MKELSITGDAGKSIVMHEAGIWLTNFISDRTRETYKKAIGEFTSFAGLESPDDLYDVDSAVVLAWREHLIGLGMSNNSVANRLSALSSLFRHLCDKQIVQINPVQGIKRPKAPTQGVTPSIANKLVRKILNDCAQLLEDAKTDTARRLAARNSAILHVLFFLGPRVSEVVSLNIGDIKACLLYTSPSPRDS